MVIDGRTGALHWQTQGSLQTSNSPYSFAMLSFHVRQMAHSKMWFAVNISRGMFRMIVTILAIFLFYNSGDYLWVPLWMSDHRQWFAEWVIWGSLQQTRTPFTGSVMNNLSAFSSSVFPSGTIEKATCTMVPYTFARFVHYWTNTSRCYGRECIKGHSDLWYKHRHQLQQLKLDKTSCFRGMIPNSH